MYYILKFYDAGDPGGPSGDLLHTSIEDDIFSVGIDAQKISSVDFYKTESQNTKILLDGDSTKWYYQNIYVNPLMMYNIATGYSEKYLKYKVQIFDDTEVIYTGWIKLDSIKYNKKNEEISFTLYNSIGLIFTETENINSIAGTEWTVLGLMKYILFLLRTIHLSLNVTTDSSLYSSQTGYVYDDEKIDDYDYSTWGDEIDSWLNLYDNGSNIFLDATKHEYSFYIRRNDVNDYRLYVTYSNTLRYYKYSGIISLDFEITDFGSGEDIYIGRFLTEEDAEEYAAEIRPNYFLIPEQYQVQNTQHVFGGGTYTVFDFIRFDGTVALINIILNDDVRGKASYKDIIEALLLSANIALISKPNGDIQIANKFIYDTAYSDIAIDEEEVFKYDASYILRSVPEYSKITDIFNFTDDFISSLQTWYKNKFNEIPENLSIILDLDNTQYNIFQKLIIFGRDWQINSLKKDYRNETISIDLWG